MNDISDNLNSIPQSTFFSSVISAAQNVSFALRGANPDVEPAITNIHQRSISDSVISPPPSTIIMSYPIEPVPPPTLMLGKGELSLASLGLPEQGHSQVITSEPSFNLTMDTQHLEDQATKGPESSSKLPQDQNALLIPSSPSPDQPELKHRKSFDTLSWKRPRKTSKTDLRKQKSIEKAMTMPATSQSSLALRKSSGSTPSPTLDAIDDSSSDRPKPRGDVDAGKRLTGFAYTNKRRNQDFHKLFRSLPLHDFLLDDFSCALSREILIQGRIYVSERNICFNSNILGWVTNLIISYNEIVGLEKKTTAGLFPNGIVVQTLHARHSFASFISRDSVYDFIMSAWRQTTARNDLMLPNGDSELDIVGFESEDDDEEEEEEEEGNGESASGSDFDEYDESDEKSSQQGYGSGSEVSTDEEFGASAKPAATAPAESVAVQAPNANDSSVSPVAGTAPQAAAKWPVPNLGPDTHAATNPEYDYAAAGEKLLINETVAAPLGVVVNLLFGEDTKWTSKFIIEKEKNVDLKGLPAFESLSPGMKRVYEYVKPLGGPVGPKQTRCLCTDTIETWDLESHVTVLTSTQTPDVPSGSSFLTKTRYTISWDDKNTTRVLLTYLVDWSAKSWFKGPIEKGTQDGQLGFSKNLLAELNASVKKSSGVSSKGRKNSASAGAVGASKKKGKKDLKRRKRSKSSLARASSGDGDSNDRAFQSFFGGVSKQLTSTPFEMVPVPLWALILVGLVFYWIFKWLFLGGGGGSGLGGGGGSRNSQLMHRLTSDRLDLIRLEEEYNVWSWIGDRAQLAGGGAGAEKGASYGAAAVGGGSSGGGGGTLGKATFNRALYNEQELKEVIRLTELRVQELKMALQR